MNKERLKMASGTELEIELTYLARFIPDEIASLTPDIMEDVYYPDIPGQRSILRLRRRGESYEITKKMPLTEGDGKRHLETTIELTREEYDALHVATGKVVGKKRYKLQLGGRTAELDIFTGDLDGLVTIDFEFDSESDVKGFVPPECCGPDVSDEHFIRGGEVAGKHYADLIADLDRLDYKRL
ncbi:MAG TPA: CYTH domain-containing protein [Candidatus Saccharimonadales bacterium]|nr:CYTH domain-containing protein [Candidatus Saccharimonadales bacterium]